MTCEACGAANEPGAEVCFHCRAVLAAVTHGTVIASRFEIVRPLGRGGMGTVYEAHDRARGESVALKLLRADLVAAPGMAERFRSEIRLARLVSDPHVCRIHDSGESEGRPWISMELVRGETLKERLQRDGPFPAATATALATQAALGLAAIHEVGIIHRDLKTANLTVDALGQVRVMDFGIAVHRADPRGPTGSGYVVGSPEYMSPEQARGRPLSPQSDLYALGVVLFELLTGRVPFRGDTPVATLLMHLEKPPPLEGEVAFALPPLAVPILRRALAKDPRDRYVSAREMAADLEALGPQLGHASTRARARYRGTVPVARIVGGLVIGLALLGGLALWLAPAPSLPPAERPAPTAPPPTALPATPLAPVSEPAPEPSPTRSPAPAPSRAPRPAPVSTLASPPADAPSNAAPSLPAATATPTLSPPPVAVAGPGPDGSLLVVVTPWADVSIDGRVVGQTPLARIPLPPGPHQVLLIHPAYQPFPRLVRIKPGETLRLSVDLTTDGVRRQP